MTETIKQFVEQITTNGSIPLSDAADGVTSIMAGALGAKIASDIRSDTELLAAFTQRLSGLVEGSDGVMTLKSKAIITTIDFIQDHKAKRAVWSLFGWLSEEAKCVGAEAVLLGMIPAIKQMFAISETGELGVTVDEVDDKANLFIRENEPITDLDDTTAWQRPYTSDAPMSAPTDGTFQEETNPEYEEAILQSLGFNP